MPSNSIKKVYDLVYSNQGGEWNDFARNWSLAKAAFKNLINELDLKVSRPSTRVDAASRQRVHPAGCSMLHHRGPWHPAGANSGKEHDR